MSGAFGRASGAPDFISLTHQTPEKDAQSQAYAYVMQQHEACEYCAVFPYGYLMPVLLESEK
jgi:hypothetical protein